jgi:hypothetical protein
MFSIVGVRVQLRIPGEGQGEKGHVTQSRKLRPLQLVAGKLERAEDWELRESVKTFDPVPSEVEGPQLMTRSQVVQYRDAVVAQNETLETGAVLQLLYPTFNRDMQWYIESKLQQVSCILILFPDRFSSSTSSRGSCACFHRSCSVIRISLALSLSPPSSVGASYYSQAHEEKHRLWRLSHAQN